MLREGQGRGRVSRGRERGPQLLLWLRKRQATKAQPPESSRRETSRPAGGRVMDPPTFSTLPNPWAGRTWGNVAEGLLSLPNDL